MAVPCDASAKSDTAQATPINMTIKRLLSDKPNAKIGVLFQNNDFGKDYLKG
jgi:hypothetical protein